MIDWNEYRVTMSGVIGFEGVLRGEFYLTDEELQKVLHQLNLVTAISPIKSRQVAAVALVQAFNSVGVEMQFKQKGTL